jgi:hypothetical protein
MIELAICVCTFVGGLALSRLFASTRSTDSSGIAHEPNNCAAYARELADKADQDAYVAWDNAGRAAAQRERNRNQN